MEAMAIGAVFTPEEGEIAETEGGGKVTVNPLVKVPACESGLITFTFHWPAAAPVMGQEPLLRVVELVKVKLVQAMSVWPDLVNLTVAPDWNLLPITEVIATEALFIALEGVMEETVGGGKVTVNPLLKVPSCASGFMTATFQAPARAPVMGQEPLLKVVELVKVKLVQVMSD